jgi:beta-lactamase class D
MNPTDLQQLFNQISDDHFPFNFNGMKSQFKPDELFKILNQLSALNAGLSKDDFIDKSVYHRFPLEHSNVDELIRTVEQFDQWMKKGTFH